MLFSGSDVMLYQKQDKVSPDTCVPASSSLIIVLGFCCSGQVSKPAFGARAESISVPSTSSLRSNSILGAASGVDFADKIIELWQRRCLKLWVMPRSLGRP